MAIRLSILMFLHFTVIGAWVPTFGPYLELLGLSATERAWIFATNGIGSIIAPVIWGQLADRWIAVEKCLCVCAAAAGGVLWVVADIETAGPLFWVSLLFWLCMMPVLSLTPTLAFRHLTHPEHTYGRVRMWGTIGWISAGWAMSLWLSLVEGRGLGDCLRFGAIMSWTVAIYALTLPSTPPLAGLAATEAGLLARVFYAPLQALRLFRYPAFALYCVCFFGLYVSWSFNLQTTAMLLQSLGFERSKLPLIMTLSQTTEVLTLSTLSWILMRLGLKKSMVLGISCWALALTILAIGRPSLLVVASLPLHGFFICCFLVAGQIFVNRIARHEFRASAQGLLVLINGSGLILGNFAVAAVRDGVGDDFPRVFMFPAIGVTGLAMVFAIGFRPPDVSTQESEAASPLR